VSVSVRPARPDEVDSLPPMYEWLFAPPGHRPPRWDPERAIEKLSGAILEPDSVVLVADHGGELVGVCAAYLDLDSVRFGPRCWVEDLAVHPDRRSEGIGSRLLAAAREWAAERGATHLELDSATARTDAQRFYEREGALRQGVIYSWEL
jgi:GNAT superfamily N-acetyltransferase